MNAYFLPSTGIYGGIKVGFQFADLLDALGVPIVVATPDGNAPQWLVSSAPVLSHQAALAMLGPDDQIIFSLPHDYQWLAATGHRLIFHCQGTDPLIDPVLQDPEVTLLTCWRQAHDYVLEHSGRVPIEVGISIADSFFYSGQTKWETRVASMPRRGAAIAGQAAQACPHLQFMAIDGAGEHAVARQLQQANYFLATAVGEWFGLPALEAMAAGCVVLSVPVLGGCEYLHHGETALMSEPDRLADALTMLSADERRADRQRLRHAGIATARDYRRALQSARLAELLRGPLAVLL